MDKSHRTNTCTGNLFIPPINLWVQRPTHNNTTCMYRQQSTDVWTFETFSIPIYELNNYTCTMCFLLVPPRRGQLPNLWITCPFQLQFTTRAWPLKKIMSFDRSMGDFTLQNVPVPFKYCDDLFLLESTPTNRPPNVEPRWGHSAPACCPNGCISGRGITTNRGRETIEYTWRAQISDLTHTPALHLLNYHNNIFFW